MSECLRLEQLPNIGPSLAADLRDLGVTEPSQLQGQDPLQLYRQLCMLRAVRQDPCVLDTFIAAVDFAQGGSAKPWWTFTAERKARYGVL